MMVCGGICIHFSCAGPFDACRPQGRICEEHGQVPRWDRHGGPGAAALRCRRRQHRAERHPQWNCGILRGAIDNRSMRSQVSGEGCVDSAQHALLCACGHNSALGLLAAGWHSALPVTPSSGSALAQSRAVVWPSAGALRRHLFEGRHPPRAHHVRASSLLSTLSCCVAAVASAGLPGAFRPAGLALSAWLAAP